MLLPLCGISMTVGLFGAPRVTRTDPGAEPPATRQIDSAKWIAVDCPVFRDDQAGYGKLPVGKAIRRPGKLPERSEFSTLEKGDQKAGHMNQSPFGAGLVDGAKRSSGAVGRSESKPAKRRALWVLKHFGGFLCAALLVFPVAGLGQEAQAGNGPAGGPALEHAKQSFATHCAPCHGLDARGGEHAPAIVGTPAAVQRTDQTLARIIQHGIPDKGMPSFHFLTHQQIEEVISYIRSLRGNNGGAANVKGDPAAGARLFFGEARCSECHMVQGKGGFIAPDLTDFGQTHSAQVIRETILQPNKDLPPQWELVNVVTHSGKHFSGMLRNEDNFSVALLSEDGAFHLLMKSDVAHISREQRSIMPDDYGSKLSSQQLDDLASFLILGLKHETPVAKNAGSPRSK